MGDPGSRLWLSAPAPGKRGEDVVATLNATAEQP